MSGKTHQLSVAIGGVFKNSFKTAISGSTHQLQTLGATIKQLKAQGKSFTQFDQLKRKTLEAKKAWHDAQNSVKQLALTLKNTDKPSKTLQKDFELAKRSAQKAKTAYLKQRNSLSELNRQFRQSGVAMGDFERQQQRIGRSVALLSRQYTLLDHTLKNRQGVLARRSNLRSQLFDAVALGAALGAPVKAAIDFESAMADVRKVVEFHEPDGLQKLGETLKALSRTIPISAAGLAQITASGGQLGIAVKDLPDFTRTVSQMVIAFDMSAEEAGEAMAKLANVYQIPINNIHTLGDAINYLSNNTAAKAREMVPALNLIGGMARQFGLSAEQASALVATLISLGKAPTTAGTAINAILSKLQTAAKQGERFQAAFAQLGLNAQTFQQAISKDAQGSLLRFFNAVEKIAPAKRSGLLLDLFGMEYQASAALLVGSLSTYKQAIQLINDPKNYHLSLQKEFNNRAATTANNLQLFKNSLAEISMNLGVVLLPALNALTNALRKVSMTIGAGAQRFPLLTKVLVGTAAGLIAVKVASIALGYAWTFIRGGAIALALVFRGIAIGVALLKTRLVALNAITLITAMRFRLLAVGGAIKAFGTMLWGLGVRTLPLVITGLRALTVACLTNPIGLIVGGIALVAGLIITHWSQVKTFFLNIWEPIKPVWTAFANWVSRLWAVISKPFNALKNGWAKIRGWGGANYSLGNSVKNLSGGISGTGSEAFQFNHSNDLTALTMQPLNGLTLNRKNLFPLSASGNNAARIQQTHHVTIHVNPKAHQNPKAIADEVMRHFQRHAQGALYDPIGVPS